MSCVVLASTAEVWYMSHFAVLCHLLSVALSWQPLVVVL